MSIQQKIIKSLSFILVSGLLLEACAPSTPPTPSTPALTIDQTAAEPFPLGSFEDVHSPAGDDANKFLFFGAVPVQPPAAGLPPELAAFLGRWEGYNFGGPIKKDQKLLLVIQEITSREATAVSWTGFNLQTEGQTAKFHLRVTPGKQGPVLEVKMIDPGAERKFSFLYDVRKDQLEGWSDTLDGQHIEGPFYLTREKTFLIYKDYPAYLAGKGITTHAYKNHQLERFGAGYMLYLPEGYADQPGRQWPLLYFLHGVGDRGDDLLVLAKASPFMFIREQGPLPFIIAAPLLTGDSSLSTFPDDYMDGVLAEIRAEYRVDARRIYLSGMSLGGEAAWRLALHQPETFAALSPLCAFLNNPDPNAMAAVKDLPVWAIHGADDVIIKPAWGQMPVDALKQAGGDVTFSVLEGHDHDVWTVTYSDPAFYDWLMQHSRP